MRMKVESRKGGRTVKREGWTLDSRKDGNKEGLTEERMEGRNGGRREMFD